MREAEETSPWNIEVSKYSTDQNFRAQCHGHGASGVAHHATTTTVSNIMDVEPTIQTTTQMSPINVRARFMDMPDVNLKFGVNESENDSLSNPSSVSASTMDTNTGRMFSSKNLFDEPEITTDTTTTTEDLPSFGRYPTAVQSQIQSQTEKTVQQSYDATQQTSSQGQAASSQATVGQTVTQTVQTITQTVYEEPREMGCGDYSDHRFPYYNLNRGCCNGKTFDTINLQCCDGVIKSKHAKC
jgi:hypothetical protein